MWGEGVRFFFLAQETAVNQIVKDEVFLSSCLEWISLTSVLTQKRFEKAALHACTWTEPGGVSSAHFKVIASRFVGTFHFCYTCSLAVVLQNTHGTAAHCQLSSSQVFLSVYIEHSRVSLLLLREHSLLYLLYNFT